MPDVAERQNLRLVTGVLDYRNAKLAISLMNQGAKGFEELAKHPELGNLLMRMLRAQNEAVESPGEAVTRVASQLDLDTDGED